MTLVKYTATAIIFISALLLALFSLKGGVSSSPMSILAFCFTFGSICFVTYGVRRNKEAFIVFAIVLFLSQLAFYTVGVLGEDPPYEFQFLQAAIFVFSASTITAFLFAGTQILSTPAAFLILFSIGAVFIFVEGFLGLNPKIIPQSPKWLQAIEPFPTLELRYKPNSVTKTFYKSDPHHYFHANDNEFDSNKSRELKTYEGNQAALVFPKSKSDFYQIEVQKVASKVPYHIQLNMSGFSVKKGHKYSVLLKIRSSAKRMISVGFSQAHGDWDNLGLYKTFEINNKWLEKKFDFVATGTDKNARIHLDAGGYSQSVDVAKVELHLGNGQKVITTLNSYQYHVDYRFNALGIRGRDYARPKPAGVKRILLLGDSYVLGVGIHEEDTLAAQLEYLLNNNKWSRQQDAVYEVINGGVCGHSSKEERLLYQLFTAQYEPDIIVLVMTFNDDRSFVEDVKQGYFYEPGKLDNILNTVKAFQIVRHRRPAPDFTRVVLEVERLNDALNDRGGRLAVLIYRNSENKSWNKLAQSITAGLVDTNIPIWDLGDTLLDPGKKESLVLNEDFDFLPNYIAHKIVAEKLFVFIEGQGLLAKY